MSSQDFRIRETKNIENDQHDFYTGKGNNWEDDDLQKAIELSQKYDNGGGFFENEDFELQRAIAES